MTDATLKLIEILKWPFVVLLVTGFLAIFFRVVLSQLLSRTRSATKSGIEFGPENPSLQAGSNEQSGRELMQTWDNQLLLTHEEKIRILLDSSTLDDAAERERYLVRLAAGSNLVAQMEQIYTTLVQSQIHLLDALNQSPVGMDTESLRAGFEAVKENEPFLESVEMETWVAYPIGRELIAVDSDGQYTIELMGREFLKYMVEQGKPRKGA